MEIFAFIDSEGIGKFLEIIGSSGKFAVGAVFGAALSWVMFRLASSDNKKRMELDMQREKEFWKQNLLKDKRIDELHSELGKERKKQK